MWAPLFEPVEFFSQHAHFLQIDVFAAEAPTQKKWRGWVESKLRLFIHRLEALPRVGVHPFPPEFISATAYPEGCGATFFFGLDFSVPPRGGRPEPPPPVAADGTTPVMRTVDITHPVEEWMGLVTNWQERTEAMLVSVAHVKRKGLPPCATDSVFGRSARGGSASKKRRKERKKSVPAAQPAAAAASSVDAAGDARGEKRRRLDPSSAEGEGASGTPPAAAAAAGTAPTSVAAAVAEAAVPVEPEDDELEADPGVGAPAMATSAPTKPVISVKLAGR